MPRKRVKWLILKVPSEMEMEVFPGQDWSAYDIWYEGEVLDTIMGVWETVLVVECTDGRIRRVNVNITTEVINEDSKEA